MNKYENLFNSCRSPWVVKSIGNLPDAILEDAIILDAHRMRSLDGYHDELSNKFNFPYYGRNNNALIDNLTDLSWFPRKRYIVVIKVTGSINAKDHIDNLETLIEILSDVAKEWNVPIELGEEWDRPCIPFHTIVQFAIEQYSDIFPNLLLL